MSEGVAEATFLSQVSSLRVSCHFVVGRGKHSIDLTWQESLLAVLFSAPLEGDFESLNCQVKQVTHSYVCCFKSGFHSPRGSLIQVLICD